MNFFTYELIEKFFFEKIPFCSQPVSPPLFLPPKCLRLLKLPQPTQALAQPPPPPPLPPVAATVRQFAVNIKNRKNHRQFFRRRPAARFLIRLIIFLIIVIHFLLLLLKTRRSFLISIHLTTRNKNHRPKCPTIWNTKVRFNRVGIIPGNIKPNRRPPAVVES